MIDMTNQEYRNWIILERGEKPKTQTSGNIWWLCQCKECGFQKTICGTEIRRNKAGACKHPNQKKSKPFITNENGGIIKNEIGNRYGKLTVIDYAYSYNSHAYWKCKCECEKETIVRGNNLRNGQIHSCGCLVSYKEYEIAKILDKINIEYEQEYSFLDLKDTNMLRFDFAVFQNQKLLGLIEYQGRQHFSNPEKFNHYGLLQKHDAMKVQYCKDNNIPLLLLDKSNDLEKDILQWLNNL